MPEAAGVTHQPRVNGPDSPWWPAKMRRSIMGMPYDIARPSTAMEVVAEKATTLFRSGRPNRKASPDTPSTAYGVIMRIRY